jgi:hypothetical protein
VFSSRKLERATYDSVAFRFIAANDHPDHDTIATFRQRFLKEIEGLFVKVLLLAREMGVLNLGTVALDGTKIHANASRHSALSYEHAGKLEAQLKAEVEKLLGKAEAADKAVISSNVKVDATGASLDVPLGHKDDSWSFAHFDTITVLVADPPRPNEILVVMEIADGGRLRTAAAPSRSGDHLTRRTGVMATISETAHEPSAEG